MSGAESPWGDLPGPVIALLREVAVHLDRLVREGEGEAIDLRALPIMTPEDLEQLREILGAGEVHATVEALGRTEIRETAFPGVWWVSYHGGEGELVAERIEIARIPDILVAQSPDISAGLRSLVEALPEHSEGGAGTAQDSPPIQWRDD